MTRHEFDLLYTIRNKGKKSVRELAELTGTSIGFVSEKLREFTDRGYIDAAGITDAGYTALEPYHVKNAIIMAAGMSTRFVPLSLEKPKGLLVVKNEVLIERQIEQLRDAGIKEIVLVLGYKKESFFYLESKYDVKIIINPDSTSKTISKPSGSRRNTSATAISAPPTTISPKTRLPIMYTSHTTHPSM